MEEKEVRTACELCVSTSCNARQSLRILKVRTLRRRLFRLHQRSIQSLYRYRQQLVDVSSVLAVIQQCTRSTLAAATTVALLRIDNDI